jgi:hypothetical protein
MLAAPWPLAAPVFIGPTATLPLLAPCPAAAPAAAAAAPEQLLGQRCTLAADMYCFGMLLIELTTQQLVTRRGKWRWPRVPQECPQACAGRLLCALPPIPRLPCCNKGSCSLPAPLVPTTIPN